MRLRKFWELRRAQAPPPLNLSSPQEALERTRTWSFEELFGTCPAFRPFPLFGLGSGEALFAFFWTLLDFSTLRVLENCSHLSTLRVGGHSPSAAAHRRSQPQKPLETLNPLNPKPPTPLRTSCRLDLRRDLPQVCKHLQLVPRMSRAYGV